MTDISKEAVKRVNELRRIAHTMPIYGAPEADPDRVYKAVRSSMRACAASGRYMDALRALTNGESDDA